jgi:hypothetical protein
MELHNPNGLITIRVKNLSKNGNPVLEKLSFDGIIWFTSFANKWYTNTGTVIHFLGLRFMKHIIYDGQFYLTEKDKKLIKKYTINN